jgi:hypothetical protein
VYGDKPEWEAQLNEDEQGYYECPCCREVTIKG